MTDLKNVMVRAAYPLICREVAACIADLIRRKPDAVLGLATGSTPIGVYEELARLHRDEELDFSRVTTFNLDEYFPIAPDAPQSYHRFMREHLFDHINCANWHVPDGRQRSVDEVRADCAQYETMIRDAGGLDFQLLGIGRTGHIGFNEPGSGQDTRTRLVTLDHITRADAAGDFFGQENVPPRAITMGVGTILQAREIIIMATGVRKADIVRQALEGKITSKVPASFLREHAHATWFLDEAAASQLTSFARPWHLPDADFVDFNLRRRTLISVSLEEQKPLGKISTHDLRNFGAQSLARQVPSLEAALQEVELDLKARTKDDLLPQNKSVLCLSPHPDDDVICCGATLLKMTERGNNVTVAYGVSGSMAVRDKDVLALLRSRHARLVAFIEREQEENRLPGTTVDDVFNQVRQEIFERESGAPDGPLLTNLKRLVREGEAADACRQMGARPLFLDLPFYHTGTVQKSPIGPGDVQKVLNALQTTQPDLVLLTGEKNDPHGTHEMCEEAFRMALPLYLEAGGKPFKTWNYRGAWNEYEAWEGSYFNVFGKELMEQKIGLILDHISQLDPVFPGQSDRREFWERARDRNRDTARQLQALGVLPPSRSFAPLYAEVFQFVS
ncbi:MAG TPA: glucosamine-6-phosphate deaminase [Abditibacteriaceae bacterium]|jgi:glucosamine-6-phosphate deaminase